MILIDKAISLYTDSIIGIMDFDRQSEVYRNDFKCPFCDARLIARKGSINAHHFASREAHSLGCPYEVSNFGVNELNQKIKIVLPDFNESPVVNTVESHSKKSKKTKIVTTSTISELKNLVELDSLISSGTISRSEIYGISGRNWNNFYIKELSSEIVKKIAENNQRGSLTPYIFQGIVSRVWNYSNNAFFNIKGKLVYGKATSVKVKIPKSNFKQETIDLWNEESFEIAVLGVPFIEEEEKFRSIYILIDNEKITERIYEFA